MHKSLFLLCVLSLMVSCSPESSKPETLVNSYDEAEMDAAVEKARSTVDEFITELKSRSADSFSVKAPITDDNGTEHFWITDVEYSAGQFSGLIGNDPGIVKNVKFGDPWKLSRDEISDWMYLRGERIHGGFTIDPLLGSYPEDQAEALRAKLVR
tara:strand:+ start:25640 stop:26104 length:465 start_codon:yes stop_codon:yes gene_type:complete